MDDLPLPTPLPFLRNRRTLRALLIDDQVWSSSPTSAA